MIEDFHWPTTEIPEDARYRYDKTIEPVPMGSIAVEAVRDSVHHIIAADTYADHQAFLEAHDPESTGVPKESIEVWMRAKHGFSEGDGLDVQTRLKLEKRVAEITAGDQEYATARELRYIRFTLANIPHIEAEIGERQFDAELDAYAQALQIEPTQVPFRQWKQHAEQRLGKDIPWFSWMSKPAEDGGATNDQLLNILQWNEYRFHMVNQDPVVQERLRQHEQSYADALTRAVASGDLHPDVLQSYQDKELPRVFIGDTLDRTLMSSSGYIDRKKVLVLHSSHAEATYSHERTHALGDLGARMWDEGATELIARVIQAQMSKNSGEERSYPAETSILTSALSLAGMTMKDLSKYYAADNADGFFKEVEKHCGRDIPALYQKVKKAVAAHLPAGTNPMVAELSAADTFARGLQALVKAPTTTK